MIKKKSIFVFALIFCLTASFIVASVGYDPWVDLDDDGYIGPSDFAIFAGQYGTSGTPINKTALLLQLQSRVEALEANTAYLSIIPNGDFEIDPASTSYNDISHWNYSVVVHMGNPPTGDSLQIVGDYYFKSGKSVYSYLQTTAVGGPPSDSIVSQDMSTEEPVLTTADYMSLWIGGDGYTTSSRYYWWIESILSDGISTHSEVLRCDCWGGNEGCNPNHYDYYNATETGADGRTWKRYTRRIPDSLDKSNLTVTVRHRQASWDWTTASSWYRLDNIYFSDSEGNPTSSILELQSRLETRIPKKGYISVSPSAFSPEINGTRYRHYTSFLQGEGKFFAQVQLPHGARITNVTAYLWDIYATYDIVVYLERNNFDDTDSLMASLATSGSPGYTVVYDDTIDYAEIDNEHHSYGLQVIFWDYSHMKLYGVVIEYEYQS